MFKKLIDWFNQVDCLIVPYPAELTPMVEFADPDRPGLVFTVPSGHIYLCPFEVDQLKREYDEKIRRSNLYRYC